MKCECGLAFYQLSEKSNIDAKRAAVRDLTHGLKFEADSFIK